MTQTIEAPTPSIDYELSPGDPGLNSLEHLNNFQVVVQTEHNAARLDAMQAAPLEHLSPAEPVRPAIMQQKDPIRYDPKDRR